MMVFFVVGTVIAAVAGLGLAIVRSRLSGEWASANHPSRRQDSVAMGLALLVSTGLVLILGGLILSTASRFPDPPLLVFGTILGVIIFLMHGILRSQVILFRWGTRRPLQLNTPAFVLRDAALGLLGYVTLGTILVALANVIPNELPAIVIIPFVVALFPLYELSVKPRLVFPRSFEVGDGEGRLSDIVAWIRQTALRRSLGRVRVALIPGDTINAYATGMGWSGRWILLGEGLVRHMDQAQLRWIAAHELAHTIRRDVPKLLVSAIATGSLHTLILVYTVFPLYDAGRAFAASMLAGMSGAVVLGVLPGLVMRRIELATDRLGVQLAGDPDAACSALHRLAEVTKHPPTQGSLTHPPVRQRVEAIRAATT
jgi:heat shock protein HtpX